MKLDIVIITCVICGFLVFTPLTIDLDLSTRFTLMAIFFSAGMILYSMKHIKERVLK